MDFTVHKLSPAIGAEIRALDLSRPLDAETVAAVRAAWMEHPVLLFRDQTLHADRQRHFVGRFGTVGGRSARLPANRLRTRTRFPGGQRRPMRRFANAGTAVRAARDTASAA
jgi:alpha-ketoglutarate-dependent taurine dioxygenase